MTRKKSTPEQSSSVHHEGSSDDGPKPYNLLGHTIPFRPPQLHRTRVHFRAGKGNGAKSANTNVHENLLRVSGGVMTWTNPRGELLPAEEAPYTLFDLETANPTLGRYQEQIPEHQICGTLNLHAIGNLLQYRILPLAEQGCTVLVDLGGQGEVPVLDFIEMNGISPLLGEALVWHVPIGSLDSVGTADSIAKRSPDTPVILYLLEKEPELRTVLSDPYCRGFLDGVLALPNVLGALDVPDLRAAFSISSRTSRTLLDVQSYEKASLIERQICRAAFNRLQAIWSPAAAWLAC